MNSRVRSEAVGRAPSARVYCHRQPRDPSVVNSSLTNDFLKRGGSLPSVLLATDWGAESVVEPQNQHHLNGARLNIRSRNKCAVTLNRGRTEALNRKHSTQDPAESLCHNDRSHLEEKMEHLSSKLSKVHDILQNRVTDAAEQTHLPQQDADPSEHFTARDYTFILLEMNGNVPAQPYDPDDFSVKNL